MVTYKVNALTFLLLLSISCALGDPVSNSSFTKEIKLHKNGFPFKINNELYLVDTDSKSIRYFKSDREVCRLTLFYAPLKSIYTLGNDKILLTGETVSEFQLIDLKNDKNCSSYDATEKNKDRGTKSDPKLGSVVTYNDTFDFFDWYQNTCMPCRYNDKGERLQVEYSLEKEYTGQDPAFLHQHDGFILEFIEDAFGVKNGYFYLFRYVNDTTAFRILDSKFKIVKQRLFDANVEVHSLTHENLTVCYKRNACESGACYYVECHLLDADFKSIAVVKLHQYNTDSKVNVVDMSVRNLASGGAMVAMDFSTDWPNYFHDKEVFVQRIRSDGSVDSPVKFDCVHNNFVHIYDFTFDNDEYCLVTSNYSGEEDYFLAKCLNTT